MQEAPQSLASVTLGLSGHAGTRGLVKAMIRPRIHVKLARHRCPAQPIRVNHVFFEEETKTADRDVGSRHEPGTACLNSGPCPAGS